MPKPTKRPKNKKQKTAQLRTWVQVRIVPIGVVLIVTMIVGIIQAQQNHQNDVTPAPKKEAVHTTKPKTPATPETAKAPVDTPPAPQPSPAAVRPKATPSPIPAPPTCTTDTSFQRADASNTPLPALGSGLTQTIDQPHYYEVYGYSSAQIRSQINQCRPTVSGVSGYDAYSPYYFRPNYTPIAASGGNCQLDGVAISVHVTFVYPHWTNGQYVESGLNARWQTYISNLMTHENGHKDIALQYGASLLSGLQNFPATDCATIMQDAANYTNTFISTVVQAQANYDTSTSHGASQGAVFN